MRSRVVFQPIHHELESRQADRVERGVIRSGNDRGPVATTPRSDSGLIHCSNIERTARFPCSQMPRTRPVPLSELKYAASFACSGFKTIVAWIAEVLAHVRARAEEPFLFPAP